MRIALLGIQARSSTPWCVQATQTAHALGAEVWTPDDKAWEMITWDSPDDAIQPTINSILNRQLAGIRACDAVVVRLGVEEVGFGARLELGRLFFTPGLSIHLYMDPGFMGRHYIRAHYPHVEGSIREYKSLDEAVRGACGSV